MHNNVASIDARVGTLDQSITSTNSKEHVYFFLKRLFDIVASLLGLIIFSPVFLVVAILIKLDSKGPVFLDHYRIGKDGKMFRIYKFRSMIDHAEEILMRWLETNPEIREEYMTNKKLENDPRITRVGKFIRATSIDELPQLINILRGEMTFVGPRPYLKIEIPDMGVCYNTIIKMTPGLTGPWQVAGRSNIGFMERCIMDVKYYRTKSLKEDTRILFKTFKVVLKKIGAK